MIDFKTNPSSVRKDLSLDKPYYYGSIRLISNVFHLSTDGHSKDVIFLDEDDFIRAMNRIASLLQKYDVIIIAFCLMDNHVHFVLYGDESVCREFISEFLRMTSMHMVYRHNLHNSLIRLPVSAEPVMDENYLKNVICYDHLNAPVGGLRYTFFDYPWSSGSTMMRASGVNAPLWTLARSACLPVAELSKLGFSTVSSLTTRQKKELAISSDVPGDWILYDGYVLPMNYIPSELVCELYSSHRAYTYFSSLDKKKSDEISGRLASVMTMQLPDAELREKKSEMCIQMFGTRSSYNLNTDQRLKLANGLRQKYLCSNKQLSRIVGLKLSDLDNLM